MQIKLTKALAAFVHDGQIVGEYVLDDSFKPHFSGLRSPSGCETTIVSPGDHRHHKGLMYALRCADLNFWEENPGNDCGVQQVLSTRKTEKGDGIVQELLWRRAGGGLDTYHEKRTIRARHDPEQNAIVFTWQTKREALRDHRLVKSEWSVEVPDGRRINYHGLGIRLPWLWRFPSRDMCGIEINGKPAEANAACGCTAESVGFWGLIDGEWNRTIAVVTIRQSSSQAFTWFVMKGDFPYLSLGPSNANEYDISAGNIHTESYEVSVADRPPGFGL